MKEFSTSRFGVRRLVVGAGLVLLAGLVRVRALAQVPEVSRLRLQGNCELLEVPIINRPLLIANRYLNT